MFPCMTPFYMHIDRYMLVTHGPVNQSLIKDVIYICFYVFGALVLKHV